ncbi:MAG: helix-turn-helix domain-containing protein [Candidatus Spechtbacterales bacterium]
MMPATLGEKLKQARTEAGFTFRELSEATKVPVNHLRSLEREEFEKLPPPVYTSGFLQRWAKVCGIEVDDVVAQFYRENKFLFQSSAKERPVPKATQQLFFIHFWYVVVGVFAGVGALLAGVFYYSQFDALSTPEIEIVSPAAFSSISHAEWIAIEGEVRAARRVFVGGQEARVEGNTFRHELSLQEGLNTISITIEGENGQQIEAIRKVLKL